MTIDKSNLGKYNNLYDAVRNYPYSWIFGGTLAGIFKPFSNNISSTGYPHHEPSLWSNTGVVGTRFQFWPGGADSSGLNPFGENTLEEGIVSGPSKPSDLNLFMDRADVRTHGFKFPLQTIGWGFDIFGYPAPNYNRYWDASGIFGSSGIPETFFAVTGGGIFGKGHEVPYDYFKSGPVDMRWDIYRKVWTSPNSVQSAKILAAYNSGALISNFTTPIFASGITYDAMVQDGEATKIIVTGVSHIGPKPYNNAYKVYPLSSGTFCFIVHNETSGVPQFAVWGLEQPGTFQCSSSSASGSTSDPYSGSDAGYISYTLLASNPLEVEYGGHGLGNISSGVVLLGNPSGTGPMYSYRFVQGNGIDVLFQKADINTPGDLTIKISDDVSFNEAGVNTTITELQGLTTPLTVSQGGTGSSSKNFIDITTNQTAGGIKSFPSGIRSGSGTQVVPSISFINDTDTGIYLLPTGNGMGFTAASTGMIFVKGLFGTDFSSQVRILSSVMPTGLAGNPNYAPLVVSQYSDPLYNNHIQIWKDRGSNNLAYIDQNGGFLSSSLSVSGTPTGVSNSISCSNISSGVYFSVNRIGSQMTLGGSGNRTTITSTSGDRTIHFSSGYHGSVDVAKVGGGTRTLQFMHGIFVGFTDS